MMRQRLSHVFRDPTHHAFVVYGGAQHPRMRRVLVDLRVPTAGEDGALQRNSRCAGIASALFASFLQLCAENVLVGSRVTQFRLILVCGGPYFTYFFLSI